MLLMTIARLLVVLPGATFNPTPGRNHASTGWLVLSIQTDTQMEILNFRPGTATKFARGLNDGLKINWMSGVSVILGVTARFQ